MEKQNMTSTDIEEEDISITQLWSVIIQQKRIILLFVVISIAITSLYVFIKKPVYESRAVIVIGQLPHQPKNLEIEAAPLFVERLKEKYRIGDETEGLREYPILYSVYVDKKTVPSIITLKARANDPQEAKAFMNNIVNKEMTHHAELFNVAIKVQMSLIQSLRDQLARVDKDIEQFEQQVRSVEARESAVAAILLMQNTELKERRDAYRRQINMLEIELLEINRWPTKVLREPTLPIQPTHPRTWYILAAGALGLIIGIMVAFFVHGRSIRARLPQRVEIASR